MKKLFLCFAVLCFIACNGNDPNDSKSFIDLGLSSGTLWRNQNEYSSQHYNYDDAILNFGKQIPLKEQWMELVNECTWSWSGMGYKVVGPNGNYIVLPAEGQLDGDYSDGDGEKGYYWTRSVIDSGSVFIFRFWEKNKSFDDATRDRMLSVRLVKNP